MVNCRSAKPTTQVQILQEALIIVYMEEGRFERYGLPKDGAEMELRRQTDLLQQIADDTKIVRRITMAVFYAAVAVALIVGLCAAITY